MKPTKPVTILVGNHPEQPPHQTKLVQGPVRDVITPAARHESGRLKGHIFEKSDSAAPTQAHRGPKGSQPGRGTPHRAPGGRGNHKGK